MFVGITILGRQIVVYNAADEIRTIKEMAGTKDTLCRIGRSAIVGTPAALGGAAGWVSGSGGVGGRAARNDGRRHAGLTASPVHFQRYAVPYHLDDVWGEFLC